MEFEFGGFGKSFCSLGGSLGIGNLNFGEFEATILKLVLDGDEYESRVLVM